MADQDASQQPKEVPLQIEDVKKLLDLMKDHDLSEVEIEEEGRRIRLRKSDKGTPAPAASPAVMNTAPPPPPAPVPASDVVTASGQESPFFTITSPMVGTFYGANAPDAEPYAKVDADIAPGKVLCIIEAMKVMNEVKSEVAGTVAEVMARDGEPVEFGQPLFKVKLKKG